MNWPDDYINKIVKGDCLDVMRSIPDNTIAGIVTDPPYALTSGGNKGFMGHEWDGALPSVEIWQEALRICKPGAHLMAFGGCYDEKTEVLTRRGWVVFPEVKMDDEVASFDIKTQLVEFQKPLEIVAIRHHGPMHKYLNNKIDLLVTPGHKMLISPLCGKKKHDWRLVPSLDVVPTSRMCKTSRGLKCANSLPFVLPGVIKGKGHGHYEKMSSVEIPSETWAAFLGLWFAEGHASSCVSKRGGHSTHVAITHFNKNNVSEMTDLLSPYFRVLLYPGSGRLRINDPRLYKHLCRFGKAATKRLPQYVKEWTPQLIRTFLDWYARGDGDKDGRIYTASKGLADDIQEIAMYAGFAADLYERKRRNGKINGRTIIARHPQYVIRLIKVQTKPEIYDRLKARKTKSVVTKEEWGGGMVYCVELGKHHTLYVRRNGKAVWCGNTRTFHRLVCAIEDAGWIVRDMICHHYGSGFPKSLDISRKIDEMLGAEREVVGSKLGLPGYSLAPDKQENKDLYNSGLKSSVKECQITAPATPQAQQWDGFGTALKPALEPICCAMAPLDGTFANNALKWGVAGLNIDAGRIDIKDEDLSRVLSSSCTSKKLHSGWDRPWRHQENAETLYKDKVKANYDKLTTKGRFPANVLFTHSPDCTDEVCSEGCPVRMIDEQSGIRTSGKHPSFRSPHNGRVFTEERKFTGQTNLEGRDANSGGASRFFMCFAHDQDIENTLCAINKARREQWKISIANTVDDNSSLPRELAASVLSDVVNLASRGEIALRNLAGLSMNVTPRLLRHACESVIKQMRNIETRSLSACLLISTEPAKENLARFAEILKPTDTTTTTQNPTVSGGYAVVATLVTTETNTERGGPDCQKTRFKFCAKASSSERGYGNTHSTVKPLALMKYLVGLLKMPVPGIILDPFAGSGTTLLACHEMGVPFIGIEREEEYVEIARRRIAGSTPSLFMNDKVEAVKKQEPADSLEQSSLFD